MLGITRALLRVAIIAVGTLGLGACASITKGTTQTLTVTTEPPGASCELKRNNITLAIINPTPGSISVDKSKDTIAVTCEKDAHENASGVLVSEFEAMTAGNLIFGGLIGLAIDASSGAMNQYPSSVGLVLPPTRFPSETDRDRFYDAIVARVRQEAEGAIKQVRDTCAPDTADGCKSAVAAIETNRDGEISTLNIKRARAKVGPG